MEVFKMKFVLEERDEKFINNLQKDIDEGKVNDLPMIVNKLDKSYYIEF